MKKSKKLTAAMTASAVMAAMVVPAASAASVNFNDISNSYAKDAIQKLADKGILNGKGDGVFDPAGNVTRAEFAKILVLSAGLDVSAAPASATFSDVVTDAWSYKYVEAASKAKLINGLGDGKFGPNDLLSREQMATMFVRALGVDVTGKGASLSFADKDQISAYAKDAVAYAVEVGLINGKGDNKFDAQGNASREAIAKVANLFLDKIVAPSELKIAGDTNVAVGEKTKFTVAGAKSVKWSVTGNGVIDQDGNFVGNAAGATTVTAVADGKTLTATVNVYGAAAAVKLVAKDANVVANNVSTTTVTVTVVDANGNPVDNFNGKVTLGYKTGYTGVAATFQQADGTFSAVPPQVDATNGVATFTVRGTAVANTYDKFVVTSVLNSTNTNITSNLDVTAVAQVNTVAQTATSIKVAPQYNTVPNNAVTPVQVTAQVLDQTGNPMLTGTYPLTFAVTGGTFAGASTTNVSQGAIFNVTDQAVEAGTSVYSVQGQTSPISVTVTSPSLTTGSTTINAVAVGAADHLALSTSQTTASSVEDTNWMPVTITLQDKSNNPVAAPAAGVTVNLDEATTAGALAFSLSKTGVGAVTSINFASGEVSKTVYVMKAGTTTKAAGKYTVTAIDNAATMTKATLDVNFSAGTASAAALQFAAGNTVAKVLPYNNPTTTVQVQLYDSKGNKVAVAGKNVQLGLALASVHSGTATINGKDAATTSAVVAQTDANGIATFNFAAQAYQGDSYTFRAKQLADANADSTWSGNVMTSAAYSIQTNVANSVTTTFKSGVQPTSSVVANQTVNVSLAFADVNGNPVTADTVKITTDANTVLGGGALLVSNDGTNAVYTVAGGSFTLTGGKVGTTTLQIQDLTNTAVTANAAINVTIGSASKVVALTPNNDQKAYTVSTAGVVGPFTLQVSDAKGNPSVAPTDLYISSADVLAAIGGGTGVRLTNTGSNVPNVKIPAGTTSVQVYAEEAVGTVTPTTAGVPLTNLIPAAIFTGVTPNAVVNTSVTPNATGAASYVNVSLTKDGVAQPVYVLGTTALSAEGVYVLTVTPKDTAGNTGAPASVTFTIDTTAPTAPTANTVSATDAVVTGTAEAGSTVEVYSGANLLGTANAAADGSYSVTIAAQAATTTLTVKATDAAGNVSAGTNVTVA